MIKDKIIHLINLDNNNFSNKNLLSWLKLNKEWKCIKWNSDLIDNLIKNNYQKMYNYYLDLEKAKKKDFASYIILYHFGGIYLNSEMICLKPLEYLLKFFKNYNIILSRKPSLNMLEKMYYSKILGVHNTSDIVSNEIILSKKKNLFWIILINKIMDLPKNTRKDLHTGYIILTNTVSIQKDKLKDIILANNNFLIPCNKYSSNCNPELSYSRHSTKNIEINLHYIYFNYFRNLKKIAIFFIFMIIIYHVNKI